MDFKLLNHFNHCAIVILYWIKIRKKKGSKKDNYKNKNDGTSYFDGIPGKPSAKHKNS